MKKILLVLFFSTSFFSSAQIDSLSINQQPTFWDNVRFGGGLGFSFGNNVTVLNISPSAIYDFNNGFALGAGVGYLYSKNLDFRSNIISPGLITLFNPAEQIQLSAEFEYLFVNQRFGDLERSLDFPALYMGVAYRTGWAAFGVRYDVLYDERDGIFTSPWSPIIRVYF